MLSKRIQLLPIWFLFFSFVSKGETSQLLIKLLAVDSSNCRNHCWMRYAQLFQRKPAAYCRRETINYLLLLSPTEMQMKEQYCCWHQTLPSQGGGKLMQTQTAFIKVECPNRSLAIRLWWDQSFASLWHLYLKMDTDKLWILLKRGIGNTAMPENHILWGRIECVRNIEFREEKN